MKSVMFASPLLFMAAVGACVVDSSDDEDSVGATEVNDTSANGLDTEESTVCNGSNECVCAAEEACALECADDVACEAVCDAGSGCNVDCAEGQTCEVQCAGSDSCDVACNGATSCTVTCPASGCTVSGCELGTCAVTCGSEPAIPAGGSVAC